MQWGMRGEGEGKLVEEKKRERSRFLPSRGQPLLVKQEVQLASLEEVGHEDDVPLVLVHSVELNLSATETVRAIKSAIIKKFNLNYL